MSMAQANAACSRSLLSLPTEILEDILQLALIPDRLWVNAIHLHARPDASSPKVTAPFSLLSYRLSDVGSQFCMRRFSLKTLMISKYLYAVLKALLCRGTILHMSDISFADALLERAGAAIGAFGFTRLSLGLTHAGLLECPATGMESVLHSLRRHFASTLEVLEIRVTFRTTGAHNRVDGVLNDGHFYRTQDGRSQRHTFPLLEACLVTFASCFNTGPGSSNANSHQGHRKPEVRLSVALAEPLRNHLLEGQIMNRYCEVHWTETGQEKYLGPSGHIGVRLKPEGSRICCHAHALHLIQFELYRRSEAVTVNGTLTLPLTKMTGD